jgi:hypothetical protein
MVMERSFWTKYPLCRYVYECPGVVGPAGEGLAPAGSVEETWPDTAGISLGKRDCRVPPEIIVVLEASLFGGPAGPGSP